MAELYTGIVSHARWMPVRHGFAYEIFMVMVDVDRLEACFPGLWPLAAVNSRTACASFNEADHMRAWRPHGEPLGVAVRAAVAEHDGGGPRAVRCGEGSGRLEVDR